MRKLVAVIGIGLLTTFIGPAPSSAAPFFCPGAVLIGPTIDGDSEYMSVHYDPVLPGKLEVSSCTHLSGSAFGGVHLSLWLPGSGKNAKTKFSGGGNCDIGTYDGKISKGVKPFVFLHSSSVYDQTGEFSDPHVCIVGPVTFFEH
jgi:hypothetical protein